MPQPREFVSAFYVKVNGQNLSEQQIDKIGDLIVEQNVHLPSACTIVFQDSGTALTSADPLVFGLTDQNVLPIGAEIEVGMGREAAPSAVFNGEVTSQDLDVAEGAAPRLVVRAYDRLHRLQRGRFSRTFLNVTDSDIAAKIARDAGLRANVDSTTQVYPYILQNNQTNLEFLRERAQHIGYEVYVTKTTLNFVKPGVDESATGTAALGTNMLRVNIHVSSVGQVSQVQVQGWNPDEMTAIVGSATSGAATASPSGQPVGSALAGTFGAATMVVTGHYVESQAEADQLAQAVADDLAAGSVYVEAEVFGDPSVQPRRMVNLSDLGERFKGSYYVTAATHRVTATRGYRTTFTVGGRRADSVLEWASAPARANGHGVGSAVAIGVVTNVKDEKNLGRVKVKLPWLADEETDWARVATPGGGSNRGFYWLPEVNDEVLVAFEQGDARRPYVIGSLWNGQDTPPEGNSAVLDAAGHVTKRIIKSRSGHTIMLDDTEGSGKIIIADSSGNNLITIDTASNKITVSAEGDLELKANGNVKVSGAAISIQAQADCEIKANGSAKVSAAATAIEAQDLCTIKGAMVNIN